MSSGASGIRTGAEETYPQGQSPLLERRETSSTSPSLLGNTPPVSDSDDDARVPDLEIRVRLVATNQMLAAGAIETTERVASTQEFPPRVRLVVNPLLAGTLERVERVATPFPGEQDPPTSLSATLETQVSGHPIVRPRPVSRMVSQPTPPTQNPPEERRGGSLEKRGREE